MARLYTYKTIQKKTTFRIATESKESKNKSNKRCARPVAENVTTLLKDVREDLINREIYPVQFSTY